MTRLTGSTGSGTVAAHGDPSQSTNASKNADGQGEAGVPGLSSRSKQVPSLDAASSPSCSSGSCSTHRCAADTTISATAVSAASVASAVKK